MVVIREVARAVAVEAVSAVVEGLPQVEFAEKYV